MAWDTALSPALPTGKVSFLFTDIEGSARLWEADPDAMENALMRHDILMRHAIGASGGTVFKTVGDAFCAAFPTLSAAVAAAVTAQIALLREPWPPSCPICVRMALHTGFAQERDNDYFGPILNRVSRLLSAGHGGQTLLADGTDTAERDLPTGVTLRDLGMRRLKDLTSPERIFQVIYPDLLDSFPPLKTLDEIPNNLPQPLTRFIGRHREMEAIAAQRGKSRLLTLVGTGGTGKTRLALQVAAEVMTVYPDGVWLVELAALADPARVPQTVAQAIGVREEAGQTITQTLIERLKAKTLLLTLDNCEHLLDACAQFTAALLRACPNIRILATSREPMGIAGEQSYRVPSLSLPDIRGVEPLTPERLLSFEAVRLFAERAEAVSPRWKVTTANAPALVQLCCRLDGIPLALELAAARVRSLSVEQINDRLDNHNRFRLLTGGDRAALPRQQTLRALVDWSYDLLEDSEKILLSRLSVFAGGWDLEAAEVICGFAPIESGDIPDLLTRLVDRSMVTAEENGRVTRYRLLETLRQYGTQKSEACGEAGLVRRFHLGYFLQFAEEGDRKLGGPEQSGWLDRLEAEQANFRAAFASSGNNVDPQGETLVWRLAVALGRFWEIRGYFGEGREQMTRLRERGRIEDTETLAKAMGRAGLLAMSQADFDAAEELVKESLSLFRALGDQSGIANGMNGLGNIAYNRGDIALAQSFYEDSLRLRRKTGDKSAVAGSLNNLGIIAYCQGDFVASRTLYEECLAVQREAGNKSRIADTLGNVGEAAYGQKQYVEAYQLWRESLEIYRELGNRNGVANTLLMMGTVSDLQGDVKAAASFHKESLQIYKEMEDRKGIADVLEKIACVLSCTTRLCTAAVLWGASDGLREGLVVIRTDADRTHLGQRRRRLRLSLDAANYRRAWEEGRFLSIEMAVAIALTDASEPDG